MVYTPADQPGGGLDEGRPLVPGRRRADLRGRKRLDIGKILDENGHKDYSLGRAPDGDRARRADRLHAALLPPRLRRVRPRDGQAAADREPAAQRGGGRARRARSTCSTPPTTAWRSTTRARSCARPGRCPTTRRSCTRDTSPTRSSPIGPQALLVDQQRATAATASSRSAATTGRRCSTTRASARSPGSRSATTRSGCGWALVRADELGGLPAVAGRRRRRASARKPAKLRIARARVRRGKLDMRLGTTSRATGRLRAVYRSSGRRTRFAIRIPSAGAAGAPIAWTVRRALPRAQRRKRTGILTLAYAGNASGPRPTAALARRATARAPAPHDDAIDDAGPAASRAAPISRRAPGVVRAAPRLRRRVRASCATARAIRRGRWSLRETLPSKAAARRRPALDPVHGARAPPHPRRVAVQGRQALSPTLRRPGGRRPRRGSARRGRARRAGAAANVRRRNGPGGSAGNHGRPGLTITPSRSAAAATATSSRPSGSRDPQREPAARHDVDPRTRDVAADGGDEQVAALGERGRGRAAVPAPGGGGDEVERGLLQRAGDDEVVDDAGGADAGARGAAGGDRADAQAGRRGLGQRAEVDDVAVAVLGRQRRRRVVVEREVARVVVLDQERARLAHDAQQLGAAVERPATRRAGWRRAAGTRRPWRRWRGTPPRAGPVRTPPRSTGTGTTRPPAIRAAAIVPRKVGDSTSTGTPGPGEDAHHRRQRGLRARRDDDVVRAEQPARLAARTTRGGGRRPRSARAPTLPGGARRVPARRRAARSAAATRPGSRSTARSAPAAAASSGCAAPTRPRRPRRARAPASPGPGRRAAGSAAGTATNVPRPGPRVDETLLGQPRDRLLDGLRAGAVARHQLADRGQPRAGRRGDRRRAQVFRYAVEKRYRQA